MAQQVTQSFSKVLAITTSDTVALPTWPLSGGRAPDALWVSVAGNVVVVFGDSTTATMGAAIGLLPVSGVIRVNATNTTATGLFALWQGA
jgi:hypothetical protein